MIPCVFCNMWLPWAESRLNALPPKKATRKWWPSGRAFNCHNDVLAGTPSREAPPYNGLNWNAPISPGITSTRDAPWNASFREPRALGRRH